MVELPVVGLEELGSSRLNGTIDAVRQALAAVGRTGEAAPLFTALLEKGSPLGLFSEEIDPVSGLLLGNYPQALTHAALVQAALALRDAHSNGTLP